MWKPQKRPKSEQEIPGSAYDLAQEYHFGQPLTVYPQSLFWLRVCFDVPRLLLIVAVCLFSLSLFLVIGAFFQLQMLSSHHLVDSLQLFQREEQAFQLQSNLIDGLLAMFFALLAIGGLGMVMRTTARVIPSYWLACSDGLLCVCPKKVEVTRWNEVTGLSRIMRWSYTLFRSGRESLSFGYPLERFEELADLVRQHIREHERNQEGKEASER